MGKRTVILLIIAFGLNASLFAQAEIEISPEAIEVNGANVFILEQDKLKLFVSQCDLETLEITSANGSNSKLPNILMPTSHALEYAIIDFSECSDGIYIIEGTKGEEQIHLSIILNRFK